MPRGTRERGVLRHRRRIRWVDFRNPEGTFTTFVMLVRDGDDYLVESDVEVAMELATPTP